MVAQTMKIESKNVFQLKKMTDLGILVLAVPVPQSCVSSKSCGSSQSTREPVSKSAR